MQWSWKNSDCIVVSANFTLFTENLSLESASTARQFVIAVVMRAYLLVYIYRSVLTQL
jgi:hypothetical protein